ncbi:hypothetical protein K439DRAFT_1622077 [Ramaria rubella]|nr:hypothetical protein K439DRAFT_1622077 [Ramaria rubella]
MLVNVVTYAVHDIRFYRIIDISCHSSNVSGSEGHSSANHLRNTAPDAHVPAKAHSKLESSVLPKEHWRYRLPRVQASNIAYVVISTSPIGFAANSDSRTRRFSTNVLRRATSVRDGGLDSRLDRRWQFGPSATSAWLGHYIKRIDTDRQPEPNLNCASRGSKVPSSVRELPWFPRRHDISQITGTTGGPASQCTGSQKPGNVALLLAGPKRV